jgi:ectoine hydroxylase-related dioxygenase (phytanoyl-CoA dioxygenase family)
MLLFKDKINYKGPGGNGFLAHTDAPAYDHVGKIGHVTANICVDEATKANGYLEVVPGSHNIDIPFINGGRIDPAWEASHEWVPVPLQPGMSFVSVQWQISTWPDSWCVAGDILFFGSYLAHRSGPNRSNTFRSMVYATYYSTAHGLDLREKYYAHRRIEFPPDHGTSLIKSFELTIKETVLT